MAKYTYTIFDANPNSSSGTEWPTHDDVALEVDSDAEAIEEVRSVMESEAAGLNTSDGYRPGDTLHALVWDEDGTIVGTPTYDLTHKDLGVSTSEDVVKALASIADASVVSDDAARISGYAPDSSDEQYGGDTAPGSAWDERCGEMLAEIQEALPSGWAACWSDDDISIERDEVAEE